MGLDNKDLLRPSETEKIFNGHPRDRSGCPPRTTSVLLTTAVSKYQVPSFPLVGTGQILRSTLSHRVALPL